MVDERDKCYALCFKEDESEQHLFGRCKNTSRIQTSVAKWLGIKVDLAIEDLSCFILNYPEMNDEEDRSIISVIWLATK